MRVIGGTCRGRRLLSPGRHLITRVRPTADRAREALFSIIGDEVVAATVLDLFAGTGALGLEALSRGANFALLIEADREVYHLLKANIAICGFTDKAFSLRRNCNADLSFLLDQAPPAGFSLILVDPPYGKNLAYLTLTRLAALPPLGIIAANSLIVLETGHREELPPRVGDLVAQRESRRYGEARFHFYSPPS